MDVSFVAPPRHCLAAEGDGWNDKEGGVRAGGRAGSEGRSCRKGWGLAVIDGRGVEGRGIGLLGFVLLLLFILFLFTYLFIVREEN